jgi:hypothetical protein
MNPFPHWEAAADLAKMFAQIAKIGNGKVNFAKSKN